MDSGIKTEKLQKLRIEAETLVESSFNKAVEAPDPAAKELYLHEFAPTPIKKEQGLRSPENGEKVMMVDAALHAADEILAKHPEALFLWPGCRTSFGGCL